MKLVLTSRERLMSVGAFLVNEFDNVIARIRGAWSVEHNEDDSHGHVHADSIASGRLTFSDISESTVATAQINNFSSPDLTTAAILRLDSALALVSITGITAPTDEHGTLLDGRVLVIENVSGTAVFVLEAEGTQSVPGNRFITPWGPPEDTANPLRFYLRPSSLTVIIYSAKKARWQVQSQANDANTEFTTFTAAQQDNVSTGSIRRMRTVRVAFSGTGGSLSGFDATNVPVTTRLTLVNAGLYKCSVLHQSTSSSSGNRVQCPGGVQYVLHPRESVDLFKTDDGWRLVEKADQWIDVTFSAGNFTTDTGTWTVASGDQTTLAYQLDGNKMTVSFDLRTTTVATNPTQLRIAVPAGRTIARTMSNSILALNAGAQISTAYVQATAGNTFLQIFRDLVATAWGAAVDTTLTQGQITFMVQDASAGISELHTDVLHGDTSHSDAAHSDVAHVDVAHGDSHSDTAHTDAAHADVAHSDTHSDTAHVDVAHVDVAHSDTHSDVLHGDEPSHHDVEDFPIFIPHEDTAHSDTHSDTAHSDTAHSDVAHSDTHSDAAHSDTAHVDGGHADSHTDTPAHADTAHADVAHGDTAHADSLHQDTGYHTDTTHADI